MQHAAMMSGAGLALGTPLEVIAANRKKVSPSDQFRVGVIGCKGMGWSNMRAPLKNE